MTDIEPVSSTKRSSSPAFWLVIVCIVAVLTRLAMLIFYQVVTFGDTPSYRRLADTVLQGFANYDGTRTPGYPVFMALAGSDHHVWLAQLLLGFLTTLLLFYIGWKLTEKPWFGGLVALGHTLNLGQLFFESDLLTESLTTFLMVLTTALMLVWLKYPRYRRWWLAFLVGLASALTLLVRPLFIYLPFYLLFIMLIARRWTALPDAPTNLPDADTRHRSNSLITGIALLVPVALLLGGWLFYVHKNFNQWSMTTMTGYHLVQHTGSYFEYVPDEYASIRDTYIKFRDAHIAQYGTQTNTIWEAIPEMSRVSGYSFYTLSKVLTRISIQLILHHPFLYLQNVVSGWWMFWRAPVYWSAEALRIPAAAGVTKLAILLERGLIFVTNLAFISLSIAFVIIEGVSVIRRRASPLAFRQTQPLLYVFLWMLLGNIWIASVLQTLLDHGDNPRFLVPLQSLVILWVAALILQLFPLRRTRQAAHSPS